MIPLLRGFSYAWLGVLLLVVAAAVLSYVRTADTLAEAYANMIAAFDPFTMTNTILIIVLVLPAFGARALADHLYKGPRR
jgi:hypothetical protein